MASEEVLKEGDSSDTVSKNEAMSREAEYRRVLRKVDIHLLPCISILYLLSFL